MATSLGSNRVFSLALLFGITVTLTLCVHLISGCAFLCSTAGEEHPAVLLAENDLVFLGELVSVDTLVFVGITEDILGRDSVHIVEYTYSPVEIFKGGDEVSEVNLWYCVRDAIGSDYSTAPKISDSIPELVYGKELRKWSDAINLIYAEGTASWAEVDSLAKGYVIQDGWKTYPSDSAIVAWLNDTDRLKSILQDRLDRSVVIYCTEKHYSTHDMHVWRGILSICDWRYVFAHEVTSEDYADWLRDLTD
ncbi:MAG: hypothetical protein KAW61_02560 [candidate division Zixibacteria bacterium]|nr:hypothetical protein [candidate division Zixibacteria bacterium]